MSFREFANSLKLDAWSRIYTYAKTWWRLLINELTLSRSFYYYVFLYRHVLPEPSGSTKTNQTEETEIFSIRKIFIMEC